MQIYNNDEVSINTKKREDFRLFDKMDSEYSKTELEKIVNTIYKHKDIQLNYVLDMLYSQGFNLINESEVDEVMIWLKQIFVLYKKAES